MCFVDFMILCCCNLPVRVRVRCNSGSFGRPRCRFEPGSSNRQEPQNRGRDLCLPGRSASARTKPDAALCPLTSTAYLRNRNDFSALLFSERKKHTRDEQRCAIFRKYSPTYVALTNVLFFVFNQVISQKKLLHDWIARLPAVLLHRTFEAWSSAAIELKLFDFMGQVICVEFHLSKRLPIVRKLLCNRCFRLLSHTRAFRQWQKLSQAVSSNLTFISAFALKQKL